MNTDLRKMIVEAEGRYLNEGENARIRDYALTMRSRLEATRRLEAAEDRIVAQASSEFASKHPDYCKDTPDAREKVERDYKLTLRYLAMAHVQNDMEFFKRSYATWIGPLLRAICPSDVLVSGQTGLRAAIDANLDAADARVFVRYLDVFIEELGKA